MQHRPMKKAPFLVAAALLLAAGPALSQDAGKDMAATRAKEPRAAPQAEAAKNDYWSRERIAHRAEARVKTVVRALEDAVGRVRAAF